MARAMVNERVKRGSKEKVEKPWEVILSGGERRRARAGSVAIKVASFAPVSKVLASRF